MTTPRYMELFNSKIEGRQNLALKERTEAIGNHDTLSAFGFEQVILFGIDSSFYIDLSRSRSSKRGVF